MAEVGRLHFNLEDFFGDGQFGPVYKGKLDETTQVHIEKIDKSKFHVDEKVLIQDHDNILQYCTVEEDLEFYYVGSEQWAASLEDLVTGNFQDEEITDWHSTIRQITEAMAYLHQKEIIHHALKPSNILISSSDGTPKIKVANFGISRVIGDQSELWQIAGNRNWMPSEIYNNKNFAFSMNIFSLGCMYAYILSGGLHPFGLKEEEQIMRIKNKEKMILTANQFHLPEEEDVVDVLVLILSMLNANPESRPTISAVLRATYFNKQSPYFNYVMELPPFQEIDETIIQLSASAVPKEDNVGTKTSTSCAGEELVVSQQHQEQITFNQAGTLQGVQLLPDNCGITVQIPEMPLYSSGGALRVKDVNAMLVNPLHFEASLPPPTPSVTSALSLISTQQAAPLSHSPSASFDFSQNESCYQSDQPSSSSSECPPLNGFGLNYSSPSVVELMVSPSSSFSIPSLKLGENSAATFFLSEFERGDNYSPAVTTVASLSIKMEFAKPLEVSAELGQCAHDSLDSNSTVFSDIKPIVSQQMSNTPGFYEVVLPTKVLLPEPSVNHPLHATQQTTSVIVAVTAEEQTKKKKLEEEKDARPAKIIKIENLVVSSPKRKLRDRNKTTIIKSAELTRARQPVTKKKVPPLLCLCRNKKIENLLTRVKSALGEMQTGHSSNSESTASMDGELSIESKALLALSTHQHNNPNFIAIARLLIEHGADINAVDHRCHNSLMIVCMMHYLEIDELIEMAKFFIKGGINLKARDKNGDSVARILIKRGFMGDSPIIRLLHSKN